MPTGAIETIFGMVDRVIDAATVEIEGRIVRFWGCEPPKRGSQESKSGSAALAEMIGDQPLLCIQVDQAKGQTIARCYAQQVDLCAAMVQAGHAADHLGVYAEEQDMARKASKGIWQSRGL